MTRLQLNAAQLEVLTWVRDGAPDGVYEGYDHRIVAARCTTAGWSRSGGMVASARRT